MRIKYLGHNMINFKKYLLEQEDFDFDVSVKDPAYETSLRHNTEYLNWIEETKLIIAGINARDDLIDGKIIYNKDYTISVNGNVYLQDQELTEIPLNFKEVYGDFNIAFNQITSLQGCPAIVHRSFYCFENKLTNLKYFPKEIRGKAEVWGNVSPFTRKQIRSVSNVSGIIITDEDVADDI